MSNFTYSDAGLAFTRRFEGLRLTAYPDAAGIWTIGYGHTGPAVRQGLAITEHQAEVFLECDLARAVTGVNCLVTAAIRQHHFDALVDFAFNLGIAALSGSALLRYVNAQDFAAAAAEFPAGTTSKAASSPACCSAVKPKQTCSARLPPAKQ